MESYNTRPIMSGSFHYSMFLRCLLVAFINMEDINFTSNVIYKCNILEPTLMLTHRTVTELTMARIYDGALRRMRKTPSN